MKFGDPKSLLSNTMRKGTKQISFFENLEILKETTSKRKRFNRQLP